MTDEFTLAYIECALWSSLDDDGEPFDSGDAELSPEAMEQMERDCRDFQEANGELLAQAYQNSWYDAPHAGHDFWLTRNGHGAGFWDRGLGDIGEKLTRASKPYGSCDLYLGDDGAIYCS